MSEYLNTTEAAKRMGTSLRNIQVMCAKGRLRGAYKSDGRWRIPAFTPLEKVRQYSLLDDNYLGAIKRIPIDFPQSLFDKVVKHCKRRGCLDFPEAVRFALMDYFDFFEQKKRKKPRRTHCSIDKLPQDLQDTLFRIVVNNEWPNDFGDVPTGNPRYLDMWDYCIRKGHRVSKSAMGRFAKRLQSLRKPPVT
jgi:hypothetical protein